MLCESPSAGFSLIALCLLLAILTVMPIRAAENPYHKVHIVAVGISNYPHSDDRLDYSEKDARRLVEVLEKKYGFTGATLLVDQRATKQAILDAIDSAGAAMAKDKTDDFIFYFSGHGLTASETKGEAGTATTQRHGFVLPYSPHLKLSDKSDLPKLWANAVSLKELTDRILALNQARHRIVILDSCFSGLAFMGKTTVDRYPEDAYSKVLSRPTVQIMTAGLDTEFALEDARLKHGVFTDALLRQLEDPKVRTIDEVFLPIRVDVRDYFASQKRGRMMTPQHRYLVQDRGTFVFVPPDRYNSWAGDLPVLSASLSGLKLRGSDLDKPVSFEDLRKVKYQRYELSDDELVRKKEWFEHRASLGDSVAAVAISEVYRLGLGVPRDPSRSKLWESEASDAGQAQQAEKNLQIALTIMSVMGQSGPGGGLTPGGASGIGTLIALFDKNSAESFRDVVGNLEEKMRKHERGDTEEKFLELRKLIDEMVTETGGKAPKEQIDDLRALVKLVENQVKFGLYEAALEDLAEAKALLVPISKEMPQPGANKKK